MASLRGRVRAGEVVLGAFLNLGSPMTAELMGRAGYDWLIVDLEHGLTTEETLVPNASRGRGNTRHICRAR